MKRRLILTILRTGVGPGFEEDLHRLQIVFAFARVGAHREVQRNLAIFVLCIQVRLSPHFFIFIIPSSNRGFERLKLAFFRENPEFGEEGKGDAAAVASPLPTCLEAMLKNNLLLIFPAILIAEGGFFEIVAKKFIPIMPSDFLRLFSDILLSRSTATTPQPAPVTS